MSIFNLTFDIITSSLLSVSLNNFESSNFYFHDFRVEVIWEMCHQVSLEHQQIKSFVLKCFYFILLLLLLQSVITIIVWGGEGALLFLGGGSFDDTGISLQI